MKAACGAAITVAQNTCSRFGDRSSSTTREESQADARTLPFNFLSRMNSQILDVLKNSTRLYYDSYIYYSYRIISAYITKVKDYYLVSNNLKIYIIASPFRFFKCYIADTATRLVKYRKSVFD